MPTFLTPTSSEVRDVLVLSPGTLSYFRERLRNRLHQLVLREFMRRENAGELTRADLARRLSKRPEQITRWLGAPGNWTLDTVSDLLLGMGMELACNATDVAGRHAPLVPPAFPAESATFVSPYSGTPYSQRGPSLSGMLGAGHSQESSQQPLYIAPNSNASRPGLLQVAFSNAA